MRCHYCGYGTKVYEVCPECNEKSLNNLGVGTQKVEEELNNLFPNARVLRMDFDTTSRKGMHEEMINSFKNHEYDILLGTQIVTKGLDFSNVTLVGVINADTSLNIPDFRSAERTYSLLSQVAGRAGRSDKLGKVIIQGFNLTHYSIINASVHNYDNFYNEEMEVRKVLKYPPYYNLSIIKIVGKSYETCMEEGAKIQSFLTRSLKNTIILGPSSTSVPKLNNKYYVQILIKYKNSKEIIEALKFIQDKYRKNNKVSLDFDLSA